MRNQTVTRIRNGESMFYHAVDWERDGLPLYTLCGRKIRSAYNWVWPEEDHPVTCQHCLKKLKKEQNQVETFQV